MAHVFITGANRGIGLALAKAYSAAGHQVSAGVRDPASAKSDLPFARIVGLDVGDDRSTAQLAAEFRDETIDVLINNAGVIGPVRQSTTDMDFAGFLETLNINTVGPLRITQALLPCLRRSKAACVAIVSSRMGSLSYTSSDRIAYRASKAAVNKVSQGLATDLATDGIAVAAFHPGWVRTDMGGSNADIDVTESAEGIRKVIDALTLEQTGRFWNYDGSTVDW